MLIEQLGLPACGKSTLNAALRKSLRVRGWKAVDLESLDKADHGIAPALRRNPATRALFRSEAFQRDHPDLMQEIDRLFLDRPAEKALLLEVFAKWHLERRMRHKNLIVNVDEGLWHRALQRIALMEGSAELEGSAGPQIDLLSRAAPTDSVVIYLQADPAETRSRRIERFRKKSSSMKQADRKIAKWVKPIAFLEAQQPMIEHACMRIEERGGKVIRLQAYEPVDKMVEQAVEKMELGAEQGIIA